MSDNKVPFCATGNTYTWGRDVVRGNLPESIASYTEYIIRKVAVKLLNIDRDKLDNNIAELSGTIKYNILDYNTSYYDKCNYAISIINNGIIDDCSDEAIELANVYLKLALDVYYKAIYRVCISEV